MNRWIDDFHPLWTEVLASPFPVKCLQIHLNTSPPFYQNLTTWEVSWIAKFNNPGDQAMFYRTNARCEHMFFSFKKFIRRVLPAIHFSPFPLRGCGIVVMGFPGLETVPERQLQRSFSVDEKCFQNAEAPQAKEFHVGLTTNGQLFQSKNLFYHNSTNGFNVGPLHMDIAKISWLQNCPKRLRESLLKPQVPHLAV